MRLLAPEVLRWSCWSVVGVTLLVPCLSSFSLCQFSTSPLWAATFILYVSLYFENDILNPCINDDLIPINILHAESFRGALNTRAAEDSVCTRQPCQVHGDWSSCLYWYVSCPQLSQHDLTCMLCHIAATWRQVLALHHKNLPTETVPCLHLQLKRCEYELYNEVNVRFIILLWWSIVILCFTGTSNWSENYFTQTAGVGLVVNQTGSAVGQGQQTVQSQLQKIFQRDWQSEYAQPLSDVHAEHCSGKKLT